MINAKRVRRRLNSLIKKENTLKNVDIERTIVLFQIAELKWVLEE